MIGWILVFIIICILRVLAGTKHERGFMNTIVCCFLGGSVLLYITG